MKHASGTAIAAIRYVISDTLQTSERVQELLGVLRLPGARLPLVVPVPDPILFALITWVELAFAQHVGSHWELSF